MREILFCGKRKDNGEWVYGYLFKQYIDGFDCWFIAQDAISANDYSEILGCVEVIPETVGQYIGMVDKNRKKIFEGNILCVHTSIVTVVKYNEYRAAFIRENPMFIYNFLHIDSDDVEIIGNIHDNPELLDGGDNGKEV